MVSLHLVARFRRARLRGMRLMISYKAIAVPDLRAIDYPCVFIGISSDFYFLGLVSALLLSRKFLVCHTFNCFVTLFASFGTVYHRFVTLLLA